ncbi:unnamed protein product [Cylicocyclus nassatus]|uniref:beta-mannosidase n=1 Tax=Cylicocyclus nassatus TaxID=53992 RepID=A0AA36GYA8_CYLNA|nr:unnamed protein product [Cylicocyclus nassatus]
MSCTMRYGQLSSKCAMDAALAFLLTFLLHQSVVVLGFETTLLHGEWQFYNSNKTINGTGIVPGDIFTDLYRLGIIPDPLYGDNHLNMRWIALENWTYTKSFAVPKEILKNNKRLFLRFNGIDTISTVILNGQSILKTNNQFVEYIAHVTNILQENNLIEVRFTSPVTYAAEKAREYQKSYGHEVPPVCPPVVYHGECHPNFIRKAQYSFSWDWGPSFPTMGLWKGIDIIAFNNHTVTDFSFTTERRSNIWFVHGDAKALVVDADDIVMRIKIEELGVDQKYIFNITRPAPLMQTLKFDVELPSEKVELWWPNGEGQQKLYEIKLECGEQKISHRIGFRHIELVQDYVDDKHKDKGRHFYFKINDRPVFLKGSNWIPASNFLAADHSRRVNFLLDSAVEAGMNTLRVWGGGVYETEEFYELADKKGLLIWQDLMFACALYPNDPGFLESVKTEIMQQVWRIKRHVSILLWAGNNENELAIRTHWWSPNNYTEDHQVYDYVKLYSGVIKPLVESIDSSRPFLLSSPSNGVRTEEEGGVSLTPGDQRYGDIHYYNELADLWRDSTYQTPRCATEFGVQSLPFASTMLKHINSSEWSYLSEQLRNRQHHPGGVLTNLFMIFSHFRIPFRCTQSLSELHNCEYVKSSSSFVDRFAYYSQAHQAIAYKTQTEHYRRFRNRLTSDGLGNTMCALYWQLNDVWAAPTWSSIDTDLNWKMVHYEARRFMAPIIVALYAIGSNDIGVSVVNDSPEDINDAKLIVDMLAWGNGFDPIYTDEKVVKVEPMSSIEVKFSTLLRTSDADFVIRARLLNSSDNFIAPETILLPERLYEVDFTEYGDVSISSFKPVDSYTYTLTINATKVSPFTWISVKTPFLGWFSDNGFTMTKPTRTVTLKLKEPLELSVKHFDVCNLKNCEKL